MELWIAGNWRVPANLPKEGREVVADLEAKVAAMAVVVGREVRAARDSVAVVVDLADPVVDLQAPNEWCNMRSSSTRTTTVN